MTALSRKEFLCMVVLVIISVFTEHGKCAVSESELFPYDVDEDRRFQFNDDDFTEHSFKIPFNFFNKTYESAFISGNGQVSFGEGMRTYTPACTPSSIPMIMAFWADSNNGIDPNNAKLLFRETIDRALLRKAAKDVFKAFPEFKGITLSWMFIVTWKGIPFFGATSSCNGTSKRNTFQLVLTTDGVHSFGLMYYNKIEWTTGTASSGNCEGLDGTPAKTGFDYGDGKTLYTVQGSCENSIINITQTSNIDEPGKWVFRIDSYLRTAKCQEFHEGRQKLRLSPSIVPAFGSVPLKLVGPCVSPTDIVNCVYKEDSIFETKMRGIVTPDSKAVVCPMPYFNVLGRKSVTLKIIQTQNHDDSKLDVGNKRLNIANAETYTGHLYVVNTGLGRERQMKVSFNRSLSDNSTIFIDAKWDPTFVEREIELLYGAMGDDNEGTRRDGRRKRSVTQEQLDLSLELYDGRSWRTFPVKSRIENSGSFNCPIDKQLVEDIINLRRPELLTVSLSRSTNNGQGGKTWNKIVANGVTTFFDFYEVASLIFPDLTRVAASNHLACKAWSYLSDPPPTDTRACPRTREQAEMDENFETDQAGDWMPFFHPRGSFSVRQKVPSQSGAGSQCVYGTDGNIMSGPPGGGTLDRYSPNYSVGWHLLYDVIPYMFCCRLSGFLNRMNCDMDYYKLRPSDDGTNYRPRRVTRAVGDPHITTFDGLTYTFNGVGEFWMLKLVDPEQNLTFKMQARMEQYISIDGVPKAASIFTAVAMEETRNGDTIIVQVSYTNEKILVVVDGERIDFDDSELQTSGLTFHHKTSQISLISAEDIRVAFSSSFAFKFSTLGPNEAALNIIGMANDRQKSFPEGLMGNCDGNMENDFKLPDGTIIPTNSTPESIHYNFGLKWMVQETESIFTYLPGKSYSDYSKPYFLPQFTLPNITSLPQNIIESCEGHNECLFDYATTGSQALASSTKLTSLEYDRHVEVASRDVKICPSVSAWHPENGYAYVSNSMIGGKINFVCNDGYYLESEDINCTCTSGINADEDPQWKCNKMNPLPIVCASIDMKMPKHDPPPTFCAVPPTLKNGFVVGTNFSIGSTIELRCKNEYKIFWKNCVFNGEVGICKEFCNVTYTCVHEEVTLADNSTQIQAVWEGFGGDITKVVCNSKMVGRLATFFRATSLIIHASTQMQLAPASLEKKPYLVGC